MKLDNGHPVSSQWVTGHLRDASIALGFEKEVTAYCVRHFVAQAYVLAGGESLPSVLSC